MVSPRAVIIEIQNPVNKFQIPNKKKLPPRAFVSDIGIWRLVPNWDLVLGIWNLNEKHKGGFKTLPYIIQCFLLP
jgi:hypothetical protein